MKKDSQKKAAVNTQKFSAPFFDKSKEQPFFEPNSNNYSHFFKIQPKLQLGHPNDQYEVEADKMADKVVKNSAPSFNTPPIQQLNHLPASNEHVNLKEEEEEEIQFKEIKSSNTIKNPPTKTIAQKLNQSNGRGSSLPTATERKMSNAFGVDFRAVKIHTDTDSVQMNQALGARAFANKNNIFFNKGEFNPGTTEGQHLLAHELTHVVQQQKNRLDKIQRWQISDTNTTQRSAPPSTTIQVSLSGIKLHFSTEYYFSAGATRPQLMASILRTLLDSQYHTGLEDEVITHFDNANWNWYGRLSANAVAEAGQAFAGTIHLDAGFSSLLINTLEGPRFNLRTNLDDRQKELISLGNSSNDIFRQIQASENPLPDWYTEWIFARVMSTNADILRLYHTSRLQLDDGTSISGRSGLIDSIRRYAAETADILEMIRIDYELGNHDTNSERDINVSIAYKRIFLVGESANILGLQNPPDSVQPANALNFMRFLRTQPALLQSAQIPQNRSARINLLERFEQFYTRSNQLNAISDELLSEEAATATDEAWSAELSSSPSIQAPLFEASTAASYRFTMAMQMDHWVNHFALYNYQWERARITTPPSGNHQDVETLGLTSTPNHREVSELHRRRARRYNEADINRVITSMGTRPSASALLLVAANNILRSFAAEMRSEVIRVTEPQNEKVIVFPEPGLYMVRCRAIPVLEGDEAVVRLPSVAYMIINIMDPVDLAVAQHTRTMDTREDARERIDEINQRLNGNMSLADANSLEQELIILMDIAGDIDQIFSGRIDRINEQLNALQNELESLERQLAIARSQDTPDRQEIDRLEAEIYIFNLRYARVIRNLEAQLENVQEIMEAREGQHEDFSGPREQIDATFVNDSGVTIALVMEATQLDSEAIAEDTQADANYRFVVADLTTNTGDVGEGEGPSRYIALSNAVVNVLENHGDYGRGNLVLTIDGQHYHRSVQAGSGAIFREALESVSMVGSIVAIVAAPLTGGASLYLLLPLGIAGALPSLYRLYERYNASTLRPDMEVAMDVVNAIGGFTGILQGAASGLRVVRIGQALLVMNTASEVGGYILMGGQMMNQLAELQNRPEGEARALFIEIMFGALVQIGMVAGGSLAEFHAQQQAHQRRTEARRATRRNTIMSEEGHGAASSPLEVVNRPIRDGETTETTTNIESQEESSNPLLTDTPEIRSSSRGSEEPSNHGIGNPEIAIPRTPEQPDRATSADPINDTPTLDHSGHRALELAGGDVAMPPTRLDSSPEEATRYRQDADRMYENMWQGFPDVPADQIRARQLEVGMFRNSETGEIILIQGDQSSVSILQSDGQGGIIAVYPGEGNKVQSWMEILETQNNGHWELIAHSHPVDPSTGTVAARNRFPSGANGDFSSILITALREGIPISSRIDFITPDGPSYTTFGVTPGADRPVWIEFPDPVTGERRRMDFLSMDSYHSWYEDHFGGNMGPVPDHFQNLQQPQRSRPLSEPTTSHVRQPSAVESTPTAIPRTPGEEGHSPHSDEALSMQNDPPISERSNISSESLTAIRSSEAISTRINEDLPALLNPDNTSAHQQLLQDINSWRALMTHLQNTNTDQSRRIMQNLQRFREEVVATLGQRFGASAASSASTRPESDVDLATTGPEAGANLLAAEAYMRQNYGEQWSDLFRMNFYTEARRLSLYTEIIPLLSPERFAGLQRHLSALTERFNLAKILMHAGDNPESQARVERFLEGHPEAAEIRTLASRSTSQRESRRQELHHTIDRLMDLYTQTPATNTEQRIQLAQEISELQIEANFLTEEAYIGPGAARMVVDQVPVAGHEALQAAFSNLEMIEHLIHQAGGDTVIAAREYELYKYMYRFSEAVRHQQLDLFNDYLARQIYQIHRDGAQSMSPGQLRAIFDHFMTFAQEALPQLRQDATLSESNLETP